MITCKFEDDGDAALRHVTVDVIVVRDNRILLVRRALHLIEGGKWALPGGYLDRDETVVEGGLREVREETGWSCKNPTFVGVTSNPYRKGDDRQNVGFVLSADADAEIAAIDDEVLEVAWIVVEELSAQELAFDHTEMVRMWLAGRDGQETVALT